MTHLLYPSPLENQKLLYKKPHGNKGKPKSKESIEKNRQKHIGKKHTQEAKEKTRIANLKNKNAFGKKHTPEQNEKFSKTRKGKKQSKEANKKNSKSQKEYNKLHPERAEKLRQSKMHIFSALDRLIKQKYCPLWTEKLRELVRMRDNHTCQLCGRIWLIRTRKFSPHHIHYDKPNCNPDLILLCTSCNTKVNKKSLRNYYESLFMNKLNDRELLFWTRKNKHG